jgi:mannose-6-phosphate isomerase-like protein (cupin superfamily)
MKNIQKYIESGILEAYVFGIAAPEEAKEVEEMANQYEGIRAAIELIGRDLENYSQANAIAPDPTIKPFLIATIDYTERMEKGERASFPPLLNEGSQISDYAEWLNRPDMQLSPEFNDLQAKIIGYTTEVLTAIVWIKEMAPQEVHEDEFEKFLIVEGTCDIIIGGEVHHLVPGNVLSIPLHKYHEVKVTSNIPCKVILQRVAA